MGKLIFRQPLDAYKKINSFYGARKDPFSNQEGVFHSGLDYKVNIGTKVYAAERGKVIRVAHNNDWGHLNKVSLNQKVKKGDEIGYSGNTGERTTGAHLHFSILDCGYRMNWHATGATGYVTAEIAPIFVDPLCYYNRTIEVDGTIDNDLTSGTLTTEELDRVQLLIKSWMEYTPAPRLMVIIPEFRDFLREIKKESYDGPVPPIRLHVNNNMTAAQMQGAQPIELVVNGRAHGIVQPDTKTYELDIWDYCVSGEN
jgi:hypothetical protein